MRKKIIQSNPFIQSLRIKCKWNIHKGTETGYRQVISASPLEVDHRVSLYTEHLVELFEGLDKGSIRLLGYICAHLRWGQDYLQLLPEKVYEELSISRASYYSSLQALTNKVIVKRETANSTYYINPSYIYCGKRHEDFKDNIVFVNSNPIKKLFDKEEELLDTSDSVPLTVIPGTGWTRPPHVTQQV